MYPTNLLQKDIKKYVNLKFLTNRNELEKFSTDCYFKLPYISKILYHLKTKFLKLYRKTQKKILTLNQLLLLSKLKLIFHVKTPFTMIRNFYWLLNSLVLDVVLAIGETCRTFKTRVEEQIKKGNNSHISRHFHSSRTYLESHILLSFKIGYEVNCKFDINFKEVFQIN